MHCWLSPSDSFDKKLIPEMWGLAPSCFIINPSHEALDGLVAAKFVAHVAVVAIVINKKENEGKKQKPSYC